MKKILYIIGIALAAIGCAKDDIANVIPTGGEITFSAGVATRVSATNDCAWSSDEDNMDEVGIFTTNSESNILFSVAADGTMESKTALFPLTSSERTYYAYHPYSNSQSETTMTIDCTDQSKVTPLLWATATSNSESVTLTFSHKYAKVVFNLEAGGFEVTSLENATATLTGAKATGSFDITTGAFNNDLTAVNITPSIVIDSEDNAKATITAYLPPTGTGTDTDIVRLYILAPTSTYLKSFTNVKWESGNLYEYDVTVGSGYDIELIGEVYNIHTAKGLKAFADLVNGYENTSGAATSGDDFAEFETANSKIKGKLTQDIDLSTICYDGNNWIPIGSPNTPVTPTYHYYEGVFEGDGHVVSGLYIYDTAANNQGLFGSIKDATISKLGVSGEVTGYMEVGGIVGYVNSANSTSKIECCYNSADVTGYEKVGGIVGYVYSTSTVECCYNSGNVTAQNVGNDEYSGSVGGIVGYVYNSNNSITCCYSYGSVSEEYNDEYIGGVVGYLSLSAPDEAVTYCYYDKETVDNSYDGKQTYVPGGAAYGNDGSVTTYCGLKTANMKGANTEGNLLYYLTNDGYGGSTSWQADTDPQINNGYPILTWQVTNND